MNQHLCRWWAREAKLELEPACPDGQSATQNISPPSLNPTGLDHMALHTNVGHLKCHSLLPRHWKTYHDKEKLFPGWCFSFKTENPDFEQLRSAILYFGS